MTEHNIPQIVAIFVMLFLSCFLFIGYFLPSIIAGFRKHHNHGAIFLLNLLLGWTALGWIVALIWSATAVRREEVLKKKIE